eukprot:UN01770
MVGRILSKTVHIQHLFQYWIKKLCDHSKIKRVGILGYSSGGPYAMAVVTYLQKV